MSRFAQDVTHWYARCDWMNCHKVVEITKTQSKPDDWVMDYDSRAYNPPIYCCESHMSKAQRVAAIMAEKDNP